jgi:MerR family transcriptional regulator/heat shock protein HspR
MTQAFYGERVHEAMGSSGARKAPERRAAEKDRSMAVYVISVAAELAGVHPQTLRIYERKGLLGPARTLGGSRRYSDEDIALLRRIQDLTSAGLNLEGVRRVIELEAEVDRLRQEVDRARADARRAVEEVHRKYRRDLVPLNMSPVRWLPQQQQ